LHGRLPAWAEQSLQELIHFAGDGASFNDRFYRYHEFGTAACAGARTREEAATARRISNR
jgi:hypothetical protein